MSLSPQSGSRAAQAVRRGEGTLTVMIRLPPHDPSAVAPGAPAEELSRGPFASQRPACDAFRQPHSPTLPELARRLP
jgi:hypothetical protein